MASYPTSVKVFTTRNNGTDKIDASHINDLQDEVNAIESGILNGTAPIVSSNVSCNDLTVTKPAPYARVYNSGDLNIPNNAFTTLSFNSQRFTSTSSMHSTGTNPSRILATSSGEYLIGGHLVWNTLPVQSNLITRILVDGVTQIAESGTLCSTTRSARQSIVTTYNLTSTQYVELQGFQDSGSTGSISAVGNSSPEFWMVKLR